MDRRTPVSSSTSTLVPSPSPSRARESRPQWMAVEAVIGQHAAQIGMAAEEHAVHIPAFPLVPAGGRKDAVDGRNRLLLVRRQLDADALVSLQRKQIVDDFEPLLPLRIVQGGDVDQHLERSEEHTSELQTLMRNS